MGTPRLDEPFEPLPVGREGTRRTRKPIEQHFKRTVEADDPTVRFGDLPGFGVQKRSSAQGYDKSLPVRQLPETVFLQPSKGRLPFGSEDLGNGLPGLFDDCRVKVNPFPACRRRQLRPQRRLAARRRAVEEEIRLFECSNVRMGDWAIDDNWQLTIGQLHCP